LKVADRVLFYPGVEGLGVITSNTYVINDEVLTVVDPGHADQAESLLRRLRRDGISVEDIDLIVNTHAHFDHCGANSALQRASGAKIAIHRLEEEFLEKSREISWMFGGELPNFKVDQHLEDGEKLATGRLAFQVIHTPGHTPGGICLYEPRLKLLISGDTVFPYGNVGRVDLPGGDRAQLLNSVRRLSRLNVEILAPGHMEVTAEGVNEQIKASLKNAELL